MSRGATWSRESITHDQLVDQVVEFYNRAPHTFAFSTHNDQYPPLRSGIPDVEIHQAGYTFYSEVKLPDDRIRPAQQEFAWLAQAAGIEVRIVSSPDDITTGGKPWPLETGRLKPAAPAPSTTRPGTTRARQAASRRRYRKR